MTYLARGYQTRCTNGVSGHWRTGIKTVLLTMPTGSGKTLTAASALERAAARGFYCLFICNRIELLEQTALAFAQVGLQFGVIAAGYTPDPSQRVQIASIDTLKRRIDTIRLRADFIVWDECRFIGAAGWTALFNRFPDAFHLGLDASPVRLDGKGLGNYFRAMVIGPTYKELQLLGHLVPFRVFAPSSIDMTGVRTVHGDYDAKQVAEKVDQPSIVGDLVSHWSRLCIGRQGLTFAASRMHSEHLAASYRDAGISAVHLDGDTPKDERRRIVAKFRRREIDILTNVDLFTSGFDVSGVSVITMARPTQSLAIFLQQCGRGSRPEGGKRDCLLLDHVNNCSRFGLPDDDREWSLDMDVSPRKRKDSESLDLAQCEKCYAVFKRGPACPECGHVREIEGRSVKQIEGELVELEVDKFRDKAARQLEVQRAETLGELMAIGKRRGYKSPLFWAKHVLDGRKAKERRAG